MPRILAACSPGEVRVAVVADGCLIDYALWRPGRPDGVGDLHRGRISAHARALAGSFVALQGTEDGFLPDSACEGPALVGRMLGVRITRAAQGGKGPRLTARLSPAEAARAADGPARLLQRGAGAVEMFAARYPASLIAVDAAFVAAMLRPALADRLRVVPAAFDSTLEDDIAALGEPMVELRGGGRLTVQPTAALTAIDIDLGTTVGAGKTATHARFAAAVIPELARQIRLRNLAGAILVDWAGLSPRRRGSLGPALQAALADDPAGCRLVGFTGLGLAEIVRGRVHPPLHELLAGPHAAAIAAARAAVAASSPGGPPRLLSAAPAVLQEIAMDAVLRAGLDGSPAHALVTKADPTLAPHSWRLSSAIEGDTL